MATVLPHVNLKHWAPAKDTRYPWAPSYVADQIREWMLETEYAEELAAAGEKVLPLLLVGETRCGKTSALCHVAKSFGLPAYRMQMASAMGSYMGETTKKVIAALEETVETTAALWILDEVDGIFGQRGEAHDGATREMNTAMTSALTLIETLPPHVTLAATTNERGLIDKAMLARFTVVEFPPWKKLDMEERKAFARSHGHEDGFVADSYGMAVQNARRFRVARVIEEAKRKEQKGGDR